MEKRIALILLLVLAVSLISGCGHQHNWQSATCVTPKTCRDCGQTDGEALGHTWQDATCAAPKTCSNCGQTEGEALKHTWQDATCAAPQTCALCGEMQGEALPHSLTEPNYQQASVCTVCGAEVGTPLTPDFETYGLTAFAEAGKEYCYTTTVYGGSGLKTEGTVVFSYVTAEPYDYNGEDYTRYTFTITATFVDDNARNHTVEAAYCWEDYYNIRLHDDSAQKARDYKVYQVSMNGELRDTLVKHTRVWNKFQSGGGQSIISFEHIVPTGYDGVVDGVRDRSVEWPDGCYIFEIDNTNLLFFRVTDWVQ